MSTLRHHLACDSVGRISLIVGSLTADYDVFTRAGSPSLAVNVIVTVSAGQIVYNSIGVPLQGAMWQSQPFAAGSVITIVNNGYIVGFSGSGGAGGVGDNGRGIAGTVGGIAISLLNDWSIDNTYGYIFAGGQGGKGGDGGSARGTSLRGGTGGGGQGLLGLDGGSFAGPGPGTAGQTAPGGAAYDGQPGSPWGVGGVAINTNGHTINWIGGNNSSQLAGAVA
jgi:hypothetical protein